MLYAAKAAANVFVRVYQPQRDSLCMDVHLLLTKIGRTDDRSFSLLGIPQIVRIPQGAFFGGAVKNG